MPIIMVNHAGLSRDAGQEQPASVSSYWINPSCAKRIGYRGLVLSDDLEMGGILKFMSIEEAAVEAIRAGAGPHRNLPPRRVDPPDLRGADR